MGKSTPASEAPIVEQIFRSSPPLGSASPEIKPGVKDRIAQEQPARFVRAPGYMIHGQPGPEPKEPNSERMDLYSVRKVTKLFFWALVTLFIGSTLWNCSNAESKDPSSRPTYTNTKATHTSITPPPGSTETKSCWTDSALKYIANPIKWIGSSRSDIFERMLDTGLELHGELINYEDLIQLANSTRLLREVIHRAELANHYRDRDLALRNKANKETLKKFEAIVTNPRFLPSIHGSDVFARGPQKLLSAMRKFAATQDKTPELHRQLWLRYRQELVMYYQRAEAWLRKITEVKDVLDECVPGAVQLLYDNFEAEEKHYNKIHDNSTYTAKEWRKKDIQRLQAQVRLVGNFRNQAKVVNKHFAATEDKLEALLRQKQKDEHMFGRIAGKNLEIRDIDAHLDAVKLLAMEVDKRWNRAKDEYKRLKEEVSIRRFDKGKHDEL